MNMHSSAVDKESLDNFEHNVERLNDVINSTKTLIKAQMVESKGRNEYLENTKLIQLNEQADVIMNNLKQELLLTEDQINDKLLKEKNNKSQYMKLNKLKDIDNKRIENSLILDDNEMNKSMSAALFSDNISEVEKKINLFSMISLFQLDILKNPLLTLILKQFIIYKLPFPRISRNQEKQTCTWTITLHIKLVLLMVSMINVIYINGLHLCYFVRQLRPRLDVKSKKILKRKRSLLLLMWLLIKVY